ncbi:MAG TPA: response regulator transcription factor [Baekduia sp.]|nr:response regulator transcription factor [Baekduia sp.]
MSEGIMGRVAVLVDQHPMWMDTVESVLRSAGVDVVAKLSSSTEAVDQLERLAPDLVVTGLLMPDDAIDGITFVRRVKELLTEARVVVFSMFDDADHVRDAFTAGADAYVLKTAHPDDLTSAVRQAFRHSMFLAPSHALAQAPIPPSAAPVPDDSHGLTRRELEILQLVAEGHSNAELARLLWVTEQTVKFHLSNIYRKLDVSNRTEASRWAQLRGILPAPQPAGRALVAVG